MTERFHEFTLSDLLSIYLRPPSPSSGSVRPWTRNASTRSRSRKPLTPIINRLRRGRLGARLSCRAHPAGAPGRSRQLAKPGVEDTDRPKDR